MYSDTNYAVKLAPDDWVIFWAFNNYSDYIKTKQLVKNKKRANQFKNAPKFVGRIQSVFEDEAVLGNGAHTRTFNLTAAGFVELDSTLFFDERLQKVNSKALQYLSDLGNFQNQLKISGFFRTQDIIPFTLGICLGVGPGSESTNQTPNSALLGLNTQTTQNRAFDFSKPSVLDS